MSVVPKFSSVCACVFLIINQEINVSCIAVFRLYMTVDLFFSGHITLDKLDRVLAMLQGVNQKALLTYDPDILF